MSVCWDVVWRDGVAICSIGRCGKGNQSVILCDAVGDEFLYDAVLCWVGFGWFVLCCVV